ncbi:hypothetical protein [Streptomyces atroolivaceus]
MGDGVQVGLTERAEVHPVGRGGERAVVDAQREAVAVENVDSPTANSSAS